jgi:hypothetical protein
MEVVEMLSVSAQLERPWVDESSGKTMATDDIGVFRDDGDGVSTQLGKDGLVSQHNAFFHCLAREGGDLGDAAHAKRGVEKSKRERRGVE